MIRPFVASVPGIFLRPMVPNLPFSTAGLHHVIMALLQAHSRFLVCNQPGPGFTVDFILLQNLGGHILPAGTLLDAPGYNVPDVVFGGLRDFGDTLSAPELGGADKLRPLNAPDGIHIFGDRCAGVIGLFPQGLEHAFQGSM